jgi:hypothetical protein
VVPFSRGVSFTFRAKLLCPRPRRLSLILSGGNPREPANRN